MARLSSLLFLAAALPFAFAGSSSQCSDGEFYFGNKDCCLPYGGTNTSTTPPLGTNQCPTSGWYWHDDKECCVPEKPVEENPPPQCSDNWGWSESACICSQPTTTTAAATSTPSAWGANNHHHRRNLKSRAAPLCPDDVEACPILGSGGLTGDYECLDTTAELESCGGCASTGAGQDCTAIEGVWNVGCEQGRCAVYSCAKGYKQSVDGQSCIKL